MHSFLLHPALKAISYPSLMRTWKLLIRTAIDEPDFDQGYALAETMGEALELAVHPETIAISTEKMWPGSPGERVFWSIGPLPRGFSGRRKT